MDRKNLYIELMRNAMVDYEEEKKNDIDVLGEVNAGTRGYYAGFLHGTLQACLRDRSLSENDKSDILRIESELYSQYFLN